MAWFGLAIFVGGIVYFAAQMLIAVHRESVTAAVAAGGLAVFCVGSVAALAVTFLASARQYAAWTPSGTTLGVNPVIAWSYGVALAGAVVGSAFSVVFGSGRGVTRYLLSSLLIISLIGLIALLKSREPGHIRVGFDDIVYADAFHTRTARWGSIVAITDMADKRARNPIVLVLENEKPIVISNADRYASSGAALYWMVRHYWRHPEDRTELTDGRALERLRNAHFIPE
jgi:hypothetical protein